MKLDAVCGLLAGADPAVAGRQADVQVGAGGLVVEGGVLFGGEVFAVLEQVLDVLFPGGHRVGLVHAGDLKDGLPEAGLRPGQG